MGDTKIRRAVLFETATDENDIVFDSKMALINWKKYSYKSNTNKLKQLLGVNDIINVELELYEDVDKCDNSLRLYVYNTKKCDVTGIINKQLSYALQVSLGNRGTRSNWKEAEKGFSAKVFPVNNKELIMLVEDIVLDTQMFYFWGHENEYYDTISRQIFSKMKVEFLRGKKYSSYLGGIEDADYISIAAFCRNDGKTDFIKYKALWEEFNSYINENKMSQSRVVKEMLVLNCKTICLLNVHHPKGRQISTKKVEVILRRLPKGKYILVRTEKKPRKYTLRKVILNAFGLKKWKIGRIKIIPLKYRFTYQKMIPYVSVYEFEWEG